LAHYLLKPVKEDFRKVFGPLFTTSNTIIRKESFYPRTIRDWNALPTDTATAKSLESFKTHLLD
jgi:hypothetical protein